MSRAVGQTVGGRYRLERPLATGGMGSVWVARHVELDVAVALKFILAEAADAADTQRARFKREAQAAAQLKTPHVAQIHDFGLDGSMPYIAMELLEGEDLATHMEREGRIPVERAVSIVEQLCRGLQVAHDAGIVHRDLKPANIFLARMGGEELVKILDFGIAKLVGVRLPPGSRTSTGALMGTPHYMSPEQALGVAVGPATDLWSTAVVLFEMLTGAYPFEREPLFDVAGAVGGGPSPLASERDPSLPPSIDPFFERALAFDPKQRFQSPRELSLAFAAVAAGGPLPARSAAPATRLVAIGVPPSEDRAGVRRGTPSDVERAPTALSGAELTTIPVVGAGSAPRPPWIRSRRPLAVGVGLAASLAVGVAVWTLTGREPGAPSTSAPTLDAAATVVEGSRDPGSRPPAVAAAETSALGSTAPTVSAAAHGAPVVATSDASGDPPGRARTAPGAGAARATATASPPPTATTPATKTSTAPGVDHTFGI